MKKAILIIFLFIDGFGLLAEKALQIRLTPVTEVGKGDPVLGHITSICEDQDKNFYILDSKAIKVHKFSPGGKHILSFGRRGQGPGDMNMPHEVYCSTDDHIIVTEHSDIVSIFDSSGTFIRQYKFAENLGFVSRLSYSGGELFSAEKLGIGKFLDVILFNQKGEIVIPSLFKARKSEGVRTGENMYISLKNNLYSQMVLHSYYNGHSAVAVSQKYEILVLNSKGEIISKINRDIEAPKITSEELKEMRTSLKKSDIPTHAINSFIDRIPYRKNFFDRILISDKYVFAFRIPEDTTKDMPLPVDIFSIKGSFKGTTQLLKRPIYITSDFMYFPSMDEEDNLFLVKHKYETTGI